MITDYANEYPDFINLSGDEWEALDDSDQTSVSDWDDEQASVDELERAYNEMWGSY